MEMLRKLPNWVFWVVLWGLGVAGAFCFWQAVEAMNHRMVHQVVDCSLCEGQATKEAKCEGQAELIVDTIGDGVERILDRLDEVAAACQKGGR